MCVDPSPAASSLLSIFWFKLSQGQRGEYIALVIFVVILIQRFTHSFV